MTLTYLIIIGIVVMMLLGISIIMFVVLYQKRMIAHQLELIQASIQSEEQERARIAAELHDDVNATLSSARLFLYRSKDKGFNEDAINHSKQLLDESIGKIRTISHNLQPAVLQYLGLTDSLANMAESINRSKTITTQHLAHTTIPRTATNIELGAYRITQELVTNIVKHSGSSYIRIESGVEGNTINISIFHDGVGMTQDMFEVLLYKKGSTGLKNIANRQKSIGARLRFFKDSEQGDYRIELITPLIKQ